MMSGLPDKTYQDLFSGFGSNDGGEVSEVGCANLPDMKQWIHAKGGKSFKKYLL